MAFGRTAERGGRMLDASGLGAGPGSDLGLGLGRGIRAWMYDHKGYIVLLT